jgi:glycerophosphoryl diester phosphodiesterase
MNPLLDLSARPVIAHRGASGSAPENTVPAFELAVRQGADALELDVRLTRDGVPVVLHDSSLERTTDHRGAVGTVTLTELAEVDAGARFTADRGHTYPFRGGVARVPTLAEVLRGFPEIPVMVEIKEPGAQEAVRQVILEEGAAERCILASEHAAALRVFREPPFAVAASSEEIGTLYRGVLLHRAPTAVGYRTLSVPERHRGLRVPTRGFVAAARRLGCPVHVWTVNDPAAALRLWSVGVSGIVTNYPDRIAAARSAPSS